MRITRCLATCAIALCLGPTGKAQTGGENCTTDAMLVFDGSGSMSEMGYNQLNEPRIFSARRAIRQAMPEIARSRRVGLLIYGPGPADSCSNIDLRFAPIPDAAPPIINAVDTLEPEGETPLTLSVSTAANVLQYRDKPGVVVLVTDGKETCGGAPCQLAAELATDGHDLTVHVIGFKVRGYYFNWDSQGNDDYQNATSVARCLADRTGGTYASTETVEELVGALKTSLGCQIIGGTAAAPGRARG